MKQIEGNIIDIHRRKIFPGILSIDQGVIVSISENTNSYDHYIVPGFIDAHVHIESSMLVPEEFSKLAIAKGTVAVVNDPHEIANVLGVEGIRFMIENSQKSLIKTFFTVPSCVPATPYDCSAGKIGVEEVRELFASYPFVALSELMNIPGVLHKDPEVWHKMDLAREHRLRIDGHAPGLTGKDLYDYIKAGISTDHESFSLREGLEKISLGMKIIIREGSAAKNYNDLKPLIKSHPGSVMFCTDDSHPDDLIQFGDIDKIVRKALEDGFDLFDVLKIASLNPIEHYDLKVGTLQEGDPADFCVWKNLNFEKLMSVYIDGQLRYSSDISLFSQSDSACFVKKDYSNLNRFNRDFLTLSDLKKPVSSKITCIKVYDGGLITDKMVFSFSSSVENLESDLNRDLLKIVYLNRYENKPPQIAFIHGIGLKKGAFATSISHDSHNVMAVGTNDEDLLNSINTVILNKGALVVVSKEKTELLPLPIAGIMSDKSGEEVAASWEKLIRLLHQNGCTLTSPFMTLSFMALIVIPHLKLGERGLFEYDQFKFLVD